MTGVRKLAEWALAINRKVCAFESEQRKLDFRAGEDVACVALRGVERGGTGGEA